MKISRPWIILGTAAVLLCTWEFRSRRSAHAVVKDIPFHSSVPGKRPRLSASGSPEDLSQRDKDAWLQHSTPRISVVDEALCWLEEELRRAAKIDDEGERKKVLREACLYWAEFDPADALGIARELGLDQSSEGVFEDILQKWAAKDFQAALAWANHESASELRDRLMARVAFVRSQTQPASAANLVVEQIPPGPAQTEAGISVLHQWALRDPRGASTWAEEFPSGDLKDRARAELNGVIRHQSALGQATK